MSDDRLARQFRLALSWREALLRQQAANTRRGIDGANRVQLSARPGPLTRAVEARLARLRKRARTEAARHAASLRRALKARERLLAQAAAGKAGSPARVNERNRRLTERIDACRAAITRLNALAAAETAEAAGGFVAMPDADYRVALRRARGNAWQAIPREDRRTLLIGAVATVAAVAGVSAFIHWGEGVRFTAEFTDEDRTRLRIVCTNDTPDPVTLHMPWQTEGDRPPGAVGAELALRKEGERRLRLLPSPGDAWTHEGTPTFLQEPVALPPRMTAEFLLDLSRLPLPDAPHVLRLTCARASGKALFRREWDRGATP